jgi:hypothetical protein
MSVDSPAEALRELIAIDLRDQPDLLTPPVPPEPPRG